MLTGQGITGNTVWPATVIESQAMKFGMMEFNDSHNSMQHQRWWNICINWEHVISCHYANGCSCSFYLHKEIMKIQIPWCIGFTGEENQFWNNWGSCIDPRDPWHRPRRILSLEVARCGARPTFIDFTWFCSIQIQGIFCKKDLRRCCSWKERSLTEFANTILVLMESNMTRPKSSLTVFLVSWAVQRLGSMT